MSIRDSFVAHFGDEQATKIEEAALGHVGSMTDVHREDKWGTEPFRYHFMACIGYECISDPRYREYHGITIPVDELRAWCLAEASLHEHDGDFPDYIALMAGAYYTWINWEQAGTEPPEGWRNFEGEHAKWKAMEPEEKMQTMRALAQEAQKMLGVHDLDMED